MRRNLSALFACLILGLLVGPAIWGSRTPMGPAASGNGPSPSVTPQVPPPPQVNGFLVASTDGLPVTSQADYYNLAQEATSQSRFDDAIALCDQGLAVSPNDARLYNERGAAWSWKDQYEKAIADYTQALRLDPQSALAYRNRASSYHHLGKDAEALADCTRALDLDPSSAAAWTLRSAVYTALQMPTQAVADQQKATELAQSSWQVVCVQGGRDNCVPPPPVVCNPVPPPPPVVGHPGARGYFGWAPTFTIPTFHVVGGFSGVGSHGTGTVAFRH